MADSDSSAPDQQPGFGPADQRIIRKAQGNGSGATPAGGQRYDEIGRTGLRNWGGFLFEEWLRDLQGRRGAETYREMADSDAVIGGCLEAIDVLVRKADWWVEPASEDAPDLAAAEFYEQVLFEDMQTSWNDTISEILSMLVYGWAYFECVWKQRLGDDKDPRKRSKFDDGRVGLRKLAIRGQDSLWMWEFDPGSDDLVAMTQNPPPDYKLRTIPLEKALLFRTRIFKDNPEGRSILRNAVRSYYMLKNIQNLEGIGIERDLAGLPMLTPPEGVDIWNANDPATLAIRREAEQLVQSIRRDEQEGILKPFGWTLELLSAGGGGKRQFDTTAIVNRYENRIATSMLADLILLGQDGVGSYALSTSKESLFSGAIDANLDKIASVFDDDFAPKLFAVNSFTGLTGMPKLKHGKVQDVDLEMIGTFLANLAKAGAPLFPNQELSERLMELAGLPKPPEEGEMLADEEVGDPDAVDPTEPDTPYDQEIDTGDEPTA
jgi:hypothetical protein